MTERVHKPRPEHEQEVEPSEEALAATAKNDKLKKELDDLLDEIDEVLDENEAITFVKDFVQKGGQ